MPTMDDLYDCQRDVIALLRACNAAGGQLDEACRVILANADTRMLAQVLLAVAYRLAAERAREEGCATGEEIQASIEERIAVLQAQVIKDPDELLREDGRGAPQG